MDLSREILQYLHYHPQSSRDEIAKGIAFGGSDATLKRIIAAGVQKGDIAVEGKARATRYCLSPLAHLLMPIDLDTYFALDVDDRQVQTSFNFDLIRFQLPAVRLFSDEENEHLHELQAEFQRHLNEMSDKEYRTEMERLGIDLSWKSSQIEGNTYSLLETERLLRESKTADGKTKEEAVMLLNHKDHCDSFSTTPIICRHCLLATSWIFISCSPKSFRLTRAFVVVEWVSLEPIIIRWIMSSKYVRLCATHAT